MDFNLSPDLAAWQARCRAFVASELTPHDAAIEKTGRIPQQALDGLRRNGMYGLNTPAAYGGAGHSMLATCLALQELAKAHIAYYYVSGSTCTSAPRASSSTVPRRSGADGCRNWQVAAWLPRSR